MNRSDQDSETETSRADSSKPSAYRWLIMILIFFLNFVTTGWIFLALPYFLPEVEADLGLSTAAAQFLFGAIPLALIVTYFLGGMAGLYFSLRNMVAIGGFLVGFSAVLRGMVPTYTGGVTSSLLAGAGIGLAVPCYISVLSKWFPPEELGLANGLRLAGVTGGAAVGQGLVGPYFLRYVGSWEVTQIAIGVTAVLVTILWTLTYRDPHSHETAEASEGTAEPFPGESDLLPTIKHFFSVTDMVLLAGIMFLVYFSTQGFIGLLPTWLDRMPFIEDGLVGFYSSLVHVFSLGGMIVIPILSDRVGRRKPFLYLALTLAMLGAIIISLANSPAIVVLAMFLGGIGGGSIFPIVLSIPGEHPEIGPELSSLAVGLIYSLGQIGGTMGPPLTGMAFDYGVIPLSASVVALVHLLTLPIVFPLSEKGIRS